MTLDGPLVVVGPGACAQSIETAHDQFITKPKDSETSNTAHVDCQHYTVVLFINMWTQMIYLNTGVNISQCDVHNLKNETLSRYL